MNKKAAVAKQAMSTFIYLFLAVLFLVGMIIFINAQRNGAPVWEDYYAKEIAKMINMAQPGDEIALDVQKITQIAGSNRITDDKKIFQFDNNNRQICVQLSAGRKSCYAYFNNIDVLNWRVYYSVPKNVLVIKMGDRSNG